MQIGKAGVVAAGALATVAVFGSAAAAAPVAGPVSADPVRTAATTLKQAAVQQATARAATQARAAVDTVARGPKHEVNQPLISIGTGTAITAAAWQTCGAASSQVLAATVALQSPNTVLGDCANANVLIRQNQVPGIISILDDTSVNALPIQVCGSNSAVLGVTAAVNSPATVIGDCSNANTLIAAPKQTAEGEQPRSVVSLLSGSVVNAVATQVCGSTAGLVGATVALQSPTTVLGDCRNSNSAIVKREPAVVPLLSNQVIDLLPLQVCASSGLIGQLGPALPIGSPAFVAGQCTSGGQEIID
ncbi:hypothetical protein Cs7R123_27480 [Catellatospora sp. TT07R-123]|uniref:hypothetical protein n=1 Tax=Catellatospora sp. TT07R-123 TaxID=2733863 RepID=UPI001B1F76F3|nr:hypothetical protein [Catellatospora sp. TT07R-123]GHJ45406.1 hypothetical protein Cs7R123_27480 [Catellatospora sp. TT07R-123]